MQSVGMQVSIAAASGAVFLQAAMPAADAAAEAAVLLAEGIGGTS